MSYFPQQPACFRHPTEPPTIMFVTNLQDDGPGSLRDALRQDVAAPLIAPAVAGCLDGDAASELVINRPFTTIAGQTGPSPGLTLRRMNVAIKASDIDLLHLKIRTGDEHHRRDHDNTDCLSIWTTGTETSRIWIGNCSLSWAIDEIMSIAAAAKVDISDITIYRSFLTEALSHSKHTKGEHSKGLLVARQKAFVRDLFIKESLFAFNRDRNPVFNWGFGSAAVLNCLHHGAAGVHIAGYEQNRETTLAWCGNVGRGLVIDQRVPLVAPQTKLYVKDNTDLAGQPLEFEPPPGSDHDAVVGKWPEAQLTPRLRGPDHHYSWDPYYQPAGVQHRVLNFAGARPADRDPIDVRVVEAVKHGLYTGDPDAFVPYATFGADPNGAWIDSVAEAGGYDERTAEHDSSFVNDAPTDPDRIREWLDGWSRRAERVT